MECIHDMLNKACSTPSPTLNIMRRTVKNAFFARKVTNKVESYKFAGNSTYTFKGNNTTKSESEKSKIAGIIYKNTKQSLASNNAYTTIDKIKSSLTNDSYTAGQTISFITYQIEEAVKFEPINSISIGSVTYIVVETENLQDKTLHLNIRQGQDEVLTTKGQPIFVLVNNEEQDIIEIKVSEFAKKDEYSNSAQFKDYAISEIKVRPKSDENFEKWQDKFDEKGVTISKHDILIDAHSPNSDIPKKFFEYGGKNEDETGEFINVWLDIQDKWFKLLKGCYCDRDLTTKEVKKIIIAMRKSESSVYVGSNKEKLFFKTNCPLPASDKTFARFTGELNRVFNTYGINTCIRRIHFLAQIYHETDRFRTTKEYNETASYAPYIGRGLMQLTHESNYQIYKSYSGVDCIADNELIANNLRNAFDSAGWFWKQGKVLGVGKTWKAPSSAPSYVTTHNPSYSKTTITYTNAANKSKSYGTIDMSLIADDDYVDVISWLVNGGSNGLSERREYLTELKKVFEYDTKCQNKK